MANHFITLEDKVRILDLFLNSDDKRKTYIANVLNFPVKTVEIVIAEYYANKIEFEIPSYTIVNSSINYGFTN